MKFRNYRILNEEPAPQGGNEDPGAAMDALSELIEVMDRAYDDATLGRKLVRWFKANESVIKQALGMPQMEAMTPVRPDPDAKKRPPTTYLPGVHDPRSPMRPGGGPKGLRKEGGPGSGPKPKVDGPDDLDLDGPKKPKAPSAGLPSDIEDKIRAAIESLESIVPDTDPAGDMPMGDMDDDMPMPDLGADDTGMDDDDAPAAPKKGKGKKDDDKLEEVFEGLRAWVRPARGRRR